MKKLICLAGIICSCLAWADDGFDAQVRTVQNKLDALGSFAINFDRTVYSALRHKNTSSSGVLWVNPPHEFHIEITSKPGKSRRDLESRKEIYIGNRKEVWKYVPTFQHAQRLPRKSLDQGAVALLARRQELTTHYRLTPWPQGGKACSSPKTKSFAYDAPPERTPGTLAVRLAPRHHSEEKVLYAVIDMQTGLLKDLRVIHSQESCARFTFSGYKARSFRTESFQFHAPPGIVVES